MKSHVAGLAIWKVGLSNSSVSLWITTRRQNPILASKKALAFLRKHREEYPRSAITFLLSRGTIDA